MLLNDPIHQKNFTTYIKSLPFKEDKIEVILQKSDIGKNPKFYLEYASLFANSFGFENANQKIRHLNIAGYLCYTYSLLLDTALDNKDVKHITLALSNIYLEETIKLLTNLFGLDKEFWGLWDLRKEEVFEASKTGKKIFHNTYVSLHEYEKLSDSKSALGKIALDSLLVLSNYQSKENYEKLMESHKYFSVGFQINDDIEDFVEDFENQEFNFAYYKFVVEQNREVTNIRELKKIFYISNTATDLYKLALSYFKKSFKIASEVGENTWLQAISGKIKETETVINTIEEYLTVINTKVLLKEKAVKINSFEYSFNENSIIEKGLNYLIKEWEKDYPEVKHIMVLSDFEGFQNERTLHITDIFQRGILTNNLIDIGNNYKTDLSKIINHEINYLVENRNKYDSGCWSYFPTVKEIAPDADDLGQMMQIFIKQGNKNIVNNHCLTGIEILLNDCYNHKTGGIETWIIPKENQSENQKKQQEFNESKWGSGPDIDVMANFLYALCLNDYEQYKDVIDKGTKYIYDRMEKDCFWNSRWYYGWQYGTMICVRLGFELSKYNIEFKNSYSKVFCDIRNYIIENQNQDGGWSINLTANSDSLCTSLALITLMYFDDSCDSEKIRKGVTFLESKQYLDGSWEAIPFIKPKLNEPYKSKGITTSYVLNVLTNYHESNFVC